MPGLYAFLPKAGDTSGYDSGRLIVEPHSLRGYGSETPLDDRGIVVGTFAYPNYPVEISRTSDTSLIVEGCVSGKSVAVIEAELSVILGGLPEGDVNDTNPLLEWLGNTHGDFLILAHSTKTGYTAIFGDLLGRLPLYVTESERHHVITREIGIAVINSSRRDIDRKALAEYLTFGYSLGGKTIYSGLRRAMPSTLVLYDASDGSITMRQLKPPSVESGDDVESTRDYPGRLVSVFRQSCVEQTAAGRRNILSLSGGLDSRSVAAGLHSSGLEFVAFNFNKSGNESDPDVKIAREIASELQTQLIQVDLKPPTGADALKVLDQKWGLISIDQAYDVGYMDAIEREFGSAVVHFTGDGGDKVLPCHVPPFRFRSTRHLARHILNRNYVIDPKLVASLLNTTTGEIIDSVQETVESYPETNPESRYFHFLIAERAMQWLFEGEDRNRCMFWSCSPFYSNEFFKLAVAIPPESKRSHDLYRRFLVGLSPNLASIDHANRGCAVTSDNYARQIDHIARMWKYPRLLRMIRDRMRRPNPVTPDSAMLRLLSEQIESTDAIGDCLDIGVLKHLVADSRNLSNETLSSLATATSIIERISGGPETLQRFSDSRLI